MTNRTLNISSILLIAFATGHIAICQSFPEPTIRMKWSAEWISHPTAPLREPGVFHFRKVINLPVAPEHFVVHLSADNRFALFVNGKRVAEGPARGNFFRWRYETVDLAPFLSRGDNVIAATVWQYGIYAPVAQISDRLAFLLEGDTSAERIMNTDASWEVEEELGHTVIPPMPDAMHQYWAAGPGERIDGSKYDWAWKEAGSSPNGIGSVQLVRFENRLIPNGAYPDSALRMPVRNGCSVLTCFRRWSIKKFPRAA